MLAADTFAVAPDDGDAAVVEPPLDDGPDITPCVVCFMPPLTVCPFPVPVDGDVPVDDFVPVDGFVPGDGFVPMDGDGDGWDYTVIDDSCFVIDDGFFALPDDGFSTPAWDGLDWSTFTDDGVGEPVFVYDWFGVAETADGGMPVNAELVDEPVLQVYARTANFMATTAAASMMTAASPPIAAEAPAMADTSSSVYAAFASSYAQSSGDSESPRPFSSGRRTVRR